MASAQQTSHLLEALSTLTAVGNIHHLPLILSSASNIPPLTPPHRQCIHINPVLSHDLLHLNLFLHNLKQLFQQLRMFIPTFLQLRFLSLPSLIILNLRRAQFFNLGPHFLVFVPERLLVFLAAVVAFLEILHSPSEPDASEEDVAGD